MIGSLWSSLSHRSRAVQGEGYFIYVDQSSILILGSRLATSLIKGKTTHVVGRIRSLFEEKAQLIGNQSEVTTILET